MKVKNRAMEPNLEVDKETESEVAEIEGKNPKFFQMYYFSFFFFLLFFTFCFCFCLFLFYFLFSTIYFCKGG
jgi:hypothetical protein